MAGRPGAAQPSTSKPTLLQTSTPIPPSLTALRGSSTLPKNFGPPSLQLASDTVVFQAAKIPVSSSRHASTPGTAGLIATARSSGRGYSPQDSDHPRSGYAPSGSQQAYDRRPGERAHRASVARDHTSSPQTGIPPQRRPRSPPPAAVRQRVYGRDTAATNGATPSRETPLHQRAAGVHGVNGDGEFTHLLMEEDAPVGSRLHPPVENATGPTPPPTTQRHARPASAESKASSSVRNVVKLTVRVTKDGDKLGFGIRNDSNRKLKVSTLQTNSTAAKSTLQIGDTILSVNGIDLTGMGFLEVIQQLKATKPGELVFDIERSLDEDEAMSGDGDGSQQGETVDLDSPLSVTEKRFGPSATWSSPVPLQHPLPQQLRRVEVAQRGAGTPPVSGSSIHQQRGQASLKQERSPMEMAGRAGTAVGRERVPLQQGDNYGPGGQPTEPPRKRPRPAALTPTQIEMEVARMDKHHRHLFNSLTLDLKKERTEKQSLEEKNAGLRKRLQNMLIECDEVRVKANATVASIKEHAQRDLHELRQALQAARAQLRLHDRGPDVGRTDSIVNELLTTKEQFNRLRKVEMERATNLSNRFSLESRQAEREASRTRDRLIDLVVTQLRDIARRTYNSSGVRTSGKDPTTVVVQWEGLRRLAFVKMFGLPCSYEWYTSDAYSAPTLVRHMLPKQDDVMEVFGSALCHEERAGLFVVATAPMNVAYDPTLEKLTLSCAWTEQNQLRELARNFRF